MSTAAELLAPEWTSAPDQEVFKPMPGNLHAAVQSNLTLELSRERKYRVFGELDLRINGRPLRPDLCLYRREPLQLDRELPRLEEPPLLVVEILSAGQGYGDLMERRSFYLDAGVQSFWLVSPPILAITIFTPDGEQQTFVRSGVVTDPALGVTADLAAVFS